MNVSYRTGLSAVEVHANLLSSAKALRQAEQNTVLWFSEVMERRLYHELGHASMLLYAQHALGFSRSKSYEFLRLTRELERLPRTRAAVADGTLGWTKAKEVVGVASVETETDWLALAQKSTQRKLKASAQQAKSQARASSKKQRECLPAASVPHAEVRVSTSLSFSPSQREQFDKLLETLHKQGVTGSREELLLLGLQMLANEKSRRLDSGPVAQIVIEECPQCHAATTGGRPIDDSELAAAHCDAVIQKHGRNRAVISPSVRRKVLARDHFQCTASACEARRYLQVHHVIPRKHGGTNVVANLVTMCGSCHRQVHRVQPP